jgi:outer membrane protein assembly factor BamB
MPVPAVIVCCSGWMALAGWLGAALSAGAASDEPGSGRTGQPALAWHVAGEGRGTPAVHSKRAYFLSKRHEVVAVDVTTGRVQWRRPTRGPGDTTAGTVIVASAFGIVAGDGGLVAFTADGRERWRFHTGEDELVGVYLGEASDGRVFTGSLAGRLLAIDAASGSLSWATQVASDGKTTVFAPVVAGGVVIAGFTSFGSAPAGGLVAVDATTGRVRWRRWLPFQDRTRAPRAFAGGPVVAGRTVLAAGQDGAIHAFEIATGRPGQSTAAPRTTPDGSYEYRSMAVRGSLLVVASLSGLVTAYDLSVRRERWRRQPVPASVVFGIAVGDGAAYVPYLSGRLVALDLESGRERWRTSDPAAEFSWKPLAADGLVLASSSTAGYFAFRP